MNRDDQQALIEQIVVDRDAIFRLMRADWSREWFTADLTLPQMRVLLLLDHDGSLTMSHLAEALGKAQPTVTGLVDRLAEHGLIERVENPDDRRSTVVRLTAAGQRLIDTMSLVGGSQMRRLVGGLDRDELRLVAAAFALLHRQAERLACKMRNA